MAASKRWEWLESNDDWEVFDAKIQKTLDTECENGNKTAKFTVNGNHFEVSFVTMMQKTVKTGFERPVRYSIRSKNDDDFYSWQWQDDKKHWVYYAPADVIEINKHYEKAELSFNLTMANKTTYEINFSSMKQINNKTKFSRAIKIIKSECKIEDKKEDEEESVEVKVVKKEEVLLDEDNNDRPSRNLRKRKSNASSVAHDENTDDATKRKKATLKKETSSSSTASKGKTSSKIKEEDEDEELEVIEVKVKVEEEKEEEVVKKPKLKKETSAAKKSKAKKSSKIEEVEEEEEIADVKEEKIEKEEEKVTAKKTKLKKEASTASIETTASKRSARTAKKAKKSDDEDEEEKIDVDSHVSKSQANFEKKALKEKKEDNVKTLKFTGKVPVDDEFVEAHGEDYHIYIENSVAYDCMLNQTNLQNNNNKYYLLQLLEHNKTKTYAVWFRWGRVGKTGQKSCEKFGGDLERAKTVFCRKFADKTKNEWEYKDEFEKMPGKYDIVLKDYDASNEAEIKKVAEEDEEKPKVPDSKLDKRLQNLIDLICSVKNMEDILKELKYDTKKAPLGKLSASQIKAGYAALKKIEGFINEADFGRGFIEACNEFYTRIPHDFGMKVPTPIRTKQALKEKIELLEALADIEVAVKMLNQKSSIDNPIDRAYEQLECDLKPLDANDKMYKLISDYLQKTHAPTHCTYKMKVLDIFEVHKQIEHDRFKDVGNRMLLWHGSRTTNWAGILSQGLKIAPPEAPVTGYMFGKGCYFADCSSKSANYCYASRNKNVALVSLSEVALGDCNELLHDDYDADKLPKNKSSTKGLGKSEPNSKQWVKLDDGLTVPIGDIIQTGHANPKGYTLLYNEYVVYDVAQIKTKYVLKVEFDYDLD